MGEEQKKLDDQLRRRTAIGILIDTLYKLQHEEPLDETLQELLQKICAVVLISFDFKPVETVEVEVEVEQTIDKDLDLPWDENKIAPWD